jgi:alkylation response protein AidB-like acyl-CoA dehydrogenase
MFAGAELHAVHIPEGYGGQGAGARALAVAIEEVARACG